MSRGSGRARARRRRGKATATYLTALAVVVVAVAIGIYARVSAVHRDPDTMCRADGERGPLTVLLIDTTDPYSPAQGQYLKRYFRRLIDEMPTEGELMLFVVRNGAEERFEPQFRLCNPGRGRDASRLWSNPELIERQWAEKFSSGAIGQLEEELRASEDDRSPIMEMIQTANLSALPDGPSSRPVRLAIASDFLQHSDAFSQYSNPSMSFETFSRQPSYQRVRTNLSGVEVDLLYARRGGRAGRIQGNGHQRFWNDFLEANGATIGSLALVEG